MKTTVTTETDLVSGQKIHSFELSPVPINTPVGLAPGQVRITAEKSGALSRLELILRPTLVAFRGAIDRLAKAADWEVPVAQLRNLSAEEQPVVYLSLRPEAIAEITTPIQSPADLTDVLNHPAVQEPKNYVVDTIVAEA